jgi:hypothetical protein
LYRSAEYESKNGKLLKLEDRGSFRHFICVSSILLKGRLSKSKIDQKWAILEEIILNRQ